MHSQNLYISQEGLDRLAQKGRDPSGRGFTWTTEIDTELPVLLDPENPHTWTVPRTLGQIFHRLVRESPNHQLLFEYDRGLKLWRGTTFSEMDEATRKMSRVFIKLGLPARSCMGILAYNSTKWALAFWGAVLSDCVPTGLYNTNSPETCFQVLSDCRARVVFVDDREQYEKILAVLDRLPELSYIIAFEKLDVPPHPRLMTFDELLRAGEERTVSLEEEVARRTLAQRPGKCCCLIYTSGTTGEPKGVMLSHDNFGFLLGVAERFKYPEGMRIISFLPLSHIAGLFSDLLTSVVCKARVYFTDREALRGTLPWYLQQVRPFVFVGVPRVFEKMADTIKHTVGSSNPVRRAIFNWSLQQGEREYGRVLRGEEPTWRYRLAKRLVFDKLRHKIGLDEAQHFVYGAAPMKEETRRFFFSLGMALNNMYGLSETTGAISGLTPPHYPEVDMKSCGRPFDGLEVSVGPEDELLFRGRTCFMGYLNKEEATRSAFDQQGRVRSGDTGRFDDRGHLFITGRLKELIITAGGENVAPYPIEALLMRRLGGFVAWAIVVGDKRPFLALLLALKNKHDPTKEPSDELDPMAIHALKAIGVQGCSRLSDVLGSKENFGRLAAVVELAIKEANEHAVSKACHVRKWAVLPRDLAIATDDLTPTLKLKRKNIDKHFKREIQALYSEPKL